jgi:hypothetical protein
MTLNCIDHAALKTSPFLALLGLEPRLPSDNLGLGGVGALRDIDSEIDPEQRKLEIENIRKEVKNNNKKAAEKMKKKHDTHLHKEKLVVGDLVYIENPPETVKSKLYKIRRGPYKIQEIKNNYNTIVVHPANDQISYEFPMSRLIKYKGKDAVKALQEPIDIEDMNADTCDDSKQERFEYILKIMRKMGVKTRKNTKVNPRDILGWRIWVPWTQAEARGNWLGTIQDWDPVSETYWVQYDQVSEDGSNTYREDLWREKKSNARWWVDEDFIKNSKKSGS